VSGWQYRKIDLSQQHPRRDEVHLLNAAGAQGWELVGVTRNNIAYLKRTLATTVQVASSETSLSATPSVPTGNIHSGEPRNGVREVEPKYRDPVTNETWSGRGRMANWLKRKLDAGEDIDNYSI
jgi:hypothetical protein